MSSNELQPYNQDQFYQFRQQTYQDQLFYSNLCINSEQYVHAPTQTKLHEPLQLDNFCKSNQCHECGIRLVIMDRQQEQINKQWRSQRTSSTVVNQYNSILYKLKQGNKKFTEYIQKCHDLLNDVEFQMVAQRRVRPYNMNQNQYVEKYVEQNQLLSYNQVRRFKQYLNNSYSLMSRCCVKCGKCVEVNQKNPSAQRPTSTKQILIFLLEHAQNKYRHELSCCILHILNRLIDQLENNNPKFITPKKNPNQLEQQAMQIVQDLLEMGKINQIMFVKYWGNNYNVAGDMKLNLRDLFVKLMGIILDIWGHPSAYVYEQDQCREKRTNMKEHSQQTNKDIEVTRNSSNQHQQQYQDQQPNFSVDYSFNYTSRQEQPYNIYQYGFKGVEPGSPRKRRNNSYHQSSMNTNRYFQQSQYRHYDY